jgi:hypothetical protein
VGALRTAESARQRDSGGACADDVTRANGVDSALGEDREALAAGSPEYFQAERRTTGRL